MCRTNKWFILVLVALGQFMIAADVSIVNVALPVIQKAFSLSPAHLQWIVTAYAVGIAGLLLFGGRAADLFGRRKIFLMGAAAFTLCSLGVGVSQSGVMIITFRALQGLAAALMAPSALSIILVTFHEAHTRTKALAIWGAIASAGNACGNLFGGIITQYLGWRWDFFINIPIGMFVIICSLLVLDRHQPTSKRSGLDMRGALLATSGLMTFVYALTQAPAHGVASLQTLPYLVIAVLALSGFVLHEKHTTDPLLPLDIFRNRNLVAANVMTLAVTAGMFSVNFFTSLYLQQVLGFSAVKTGLSFLAVPLSISLATTKVPRLFKRFGHKPVLMAGTVFFTIGLFWLSHIPVGGSYVFNVLPCLIVLSLGLGTNFVGTAILATSGVSHDKSGLASGILNTSSQVGGAVGLAALAGVAAASTTRFVQTSQLPAATLHKLAQVHGFHQGYLLATAFGLIAFMVASFVVQQRTDMAQARPIWFKQLLYKANRRTQAVSLSTSKPH